MAERIFTGSDPGSIGKRNVPPLVIRGYNILDGIIVNQGQQLVYLTLQLRTKYEKGTSALRTNFTSMYVE